MAKTFMSSAHRASGDAYPFHSPTMAARAAVIEAETILAVTEPHIAPGQERTHSDMRQTIATRDYTGFGVAHEMLAESLAAFVGRDV